MTTARRGMTLVELLIAITILAIVGVGITRLITSQLRYADTRVAAKDARETSRAAVNIITTDIRMVDADSGILVASADSFTVLAPYAMGIVCGPAASGGSVIALLPYDSVTYAEGGYAGYAYIDTTTTGSAYQEVYQYRFSTTAPTRTDSATAATTAPCNTGTHVVRVFKVGAVTVQPAIPAQSYRQAAILFRRVTYAFRTSTTIPGQRGLYRHVTNGPNGDEELVAPFDTSARFRYYLNDGTVSSLVTGAALHGIRGIELRLDAKSDRIVPGAKTEERAPLTTAVFFKNRPLR